MRPFQPIKKLLIRQFTVEKNLVPQSPNRATKWSETQAPKSLATKGPRYPLSIF